jgi:hypothetical protein
MCPRDICALAFFDLQVLNVLLIPFRESLLRTIQSKEAKEDAEKMLSLTRCQCYKLGNPY